MSEELEREEKASEGETSLSGPASEFPAPEHVVRAESERALSVSALSTALLLIALGITGLAVQTGLLPESIWRIWLAFGPAIGLLAVIMGAIRKNGELILSGAGAAGLFLALFLNWFELSAPFFVIGLGLGVIIHGVLKKRVFSTSQEPT